MSNDKEVHKVEIVGPVNTNTDNYWRTQGEYRKEQVQMLKAYRWVVATSIAAIITALGTLILAIIAINEIKNMSQQSQVKGAQEVQQPNANLGEKAQ